MWLLSSKLAPILALSLCFTQAVGFSPHLLQVLGPQAANIHRLEQLVEAKARARKTISPERSALVVQNDNWNPTSASSAERQGQSAESQEFQLGWFEQPLDHFDSSNRHTFKQRYWINKRYYKQREGAPVFILDGGEVNATGRLPVLDTGIVDILAEATDGLGILLEHRYYGESIPVDNFTTDSLRWLTNEQAAADSANFMSNVKFEGISQDLTSPNTPWIYYGGSYAGARAAHMRILYPELVYGAIASGAVTHATMENWQYNEVVRHAADPRCSEYLAKATEVIDNIILNGLSKRRFKALFGLADLRHDDDFASFITKSFAYWERKAWDSDVGVNEFERFCARFIKPFGDIPDDAANNLPFGHPLRSIEVEHGFSLDFSIVNWATYIRQDPIIRACLEEVGDINACFTTHDDEVYQGTDITQTDRLWRFQMCTQWGSFVISPPDHHAPRIISRTIDLEYKLKVCRQSFQPGEHYRVPIVPNINTINALGGFNIAADRLAFIDGELDPWRPRTPHSDDAKSRPDTILRPFKIIPGAVHLWDMSGLRNRTDEPQEIQQIHREIVYFVKEWLVDWKPAQH